MPTSTRIQELIIDVHMSIDMAMRQNLPARAALYTDILCVLEDTYARY